MYTGFNLFHFTDADYPFLTLCSVDKAAATIDRSRLDFLVKKARQDGGRIWFVYNGIGYLQEPNPFFPALGLESQQLEEKYPGIFLLKM